ncbi:SWIM-type domain-containing protein [Citrus sinensis]|uniref:SWIM-type domain-containing protein n=1 Tax=Citrus sinensis TaxID=2711 RepID=A0ACB8HZX7_CITSI|nr:SWIM-type domain-containing protein [Citrus sinensis]
MRLATCSIDIYSSLEPKSSFGNRFWRVFFLHHVLPHMNSLAVSHFVCKEKENCISGFLFGKAKVKMNDKDNTTVCVTFKDTTHNLGVMDLDRFSKVSLINKHHKMQLYKMQFYLYQQPSSAKRALFQPSDTSKQNTLQLTIPGTLNLNNPISSPLAAITNESNPATHTLSAIDTSPDSGQSQSRAEASIHTDTPNIKNHNEANCDLFEDFLDTYFRSPTCHQNDLSNHNSAANSPEQQPRPSLIPLEMPSQPMTQNPKSQLYQASNPLPNSSATNHNPDTNAATAPDYDSDDNVFSLNDNNEDDNQLKVVTLTSNPGYVPSDASDGDCIRSDCESDDNEFGVNSDNEHDDVLCIMDADMRANLYIPSHAPVIFRVGLYFKNFTELAWATYRHKFEKTRITVGCEYYKCPWFLHATKPRFGAMFMVKRPNDLHTCVRLLKNPECTAEFIAWRFGNAIIDHPEINVNFIQSELRRMYGIKVSKTKLYRAKKKALETKCADHESMRYNDNEATTHFDKFVLSFPAVRDGFNSGCRPFIGIDGCHLKGPYKGILLSAVALDANNSIFPLAVCICGVENTTFIGDTRQLTIMCDRQKGIQNALAFEFPNAHVRYCGRHILSNLKAKHPLSDFKAQFWAAARASSKRSFEEAMEDVKKADVAVYETLRKLPAKYWSQHAFDNQCKTDHVTNNMTESFNAWLGVQRNLPILTMLEWMRKKIMKRMVNRRQRAQAWETAIPGRIYAKMMKNLQIGSANPVCRASEWLYEVDDRGRTYIVDLEHHVCDCGYWQLSGIPCVHAMPCILHTKKDNSQFIHGWLKQDSYLATYSGLIHLIPDKTSWPIADETDEVPVERRRYRMQWKHCKEFGHNKRGCPVNPQNANKRTRHYKNRSRIDK